MPKAEKNASAATEISMELLNVDDIAADLKIDAAVLAGVKASENWSKGKKVTKAEFEKAVKSFLENAC